MATEKQKNEQDVKKLIDALGAIAEMSLIFYRNVVASGATSDEAFKLTQAFIAANIFSNASRPNIEDG